MQACRWLGRAGQLVDLPGHQLDGVLCLGIYSVDEGEQALFGIEGRPVVRWVVRYLERAYAERLRAAEVLCPGGVQLREPAAQILRAVFAEAAFVDPLEREHALAVA